MRLVCSACFQPDFSCYCRDIRPFNPNIEFVILIHPIERRRRIATGRMSHLCLENSRLIPGADFTENREVNSLIENPEYQSFVLYPGPQSFNLSAVSLLERSGLFSPEKKLLIFVIDGTWSSAKKMMRVSRNLSDLPRLGFEPDRPSNFRVRQQPARNCHSTIEAIHQTIELIGPLRGFQTVEREHDVLLRLFNRMVEHQLDFVLRSRQNPEMSHFRRGP